MTTVAFSRSDRPARQIVTGYICGDPPADLAQRRAEAQARGDTGETLKTHQRAVDPAARRKPHR